MFPSPLEQFVPLYLFKYSDVNCRDNGHWEWYMCSWDHPTSQLKTRGIQVRIFQHLHRSQGLGAKWDLCHYESMWDYDTVWMMVNCIQMKDGMCKPSCLELRMQAEMMNHLIEIKQLPANYRGRKHLSYFKFHWGSVGLLYFCYRQRDYAR